ncbi:hypothetical protein [Paenibacillus sonchi]|uniref:hypothetical protein n=1 Tax=Paenibacillus sonchi TaxID=373687 RepID=UPI001E4A8076|nr:hypothetical protein [Paenibacillus sonchi]MCE3202690.1 hypothetical protein [Paenibacillus sonchi]
MNKNLKTKIKFLIFIIFIICFPGCSNSNSSQKATTTFTYEKFQRISKEFKATFNPNPHFTMISPDEIIIKTTSFPTNKFDSRKADVNKGSVEFPNRYEIYYKSQTSDLLIKINFIYMPQLPDDNSSSFLSINSINDLDNSNIKDNYKKIDRPTIDEYYIIKDKILIIINYIDDSLNTPTISDQQYKDFIKQELSFYEIFEQCFLKISNQ